MNVEFAKQCLLLFAGLLITAGLPLVVHAQSDVSLAYGLSETNMWYALQHFELKWNPHEFVDRTCPATEKRFYRAVEVEVPTNVVPVDNMVFIPSGTFLLGSPLDEPVRYDSGNQQSEAIYLAAPGCSKR